LVGSICWSGRFANRNWTETVRKRKGKKIRSKATKEERWEPLKEKDDFILMV